MTDIVGSTEHVAELGDRGWRDLVQVHHSIVRDGLRRHRGREVDTAGDGFFATFDAPAAAVECALEVAERVREVGLEVRAGVHVGEVEQIAGKVGGITVPIAARIMNGAGPGEVLVSSTTRDLAAGSGLRFADRGARELKGIPGNWRIFAATRADVTSATGVPADASRRRTAAVRRERSRPIWKRRPRVVGGSVAFVVVATGVVALAVVQPWRPPALAAIGEGAVGVIDTERGAIVASIPVGSRPGAIAVGDDSAWVAITGTDTVARIDLETRVATREIDVGPGPAAIAIAGGSVWVANSDARTVTRINEETARVVDTIEVGNRPVAIAPGGGSVWVAIAGDSTVVRMDAATGEVGDPIPVAGGPIAIVADDDTLWVASSEAATVTQLDARSGTALASPFTLAARPTALALGEDAVWVAAGDGTLTLIDRQSGRITQTIDIGGSPSSLAFSGGDLWVADRSGFVHHVDQSGRNAEPRRLATVAAPEEVIAGRDGELLVATHAAPDSHRGGTVVVGFTRPPGEEYLNDPLTVLIPAHPAYLQSDGLVGYRRVGGAAGAEMLPALATAIPRPTDGSRTWTFLLRPDLVYSDGRPVLASDFRRSLERSFQVDVSLFPDEPPTTIGANYWATLEGAADCITEDLAPVERCDLRAGIVTDDEARTITFRLTEPDGNFLAKLALPYAFPLPDGVPMSTLIDGAFPGTGPYTLTSARADEVRFERNPNFRIFDERVRPDGYPDEIVIRILSTDLPPEDRVELAVAGEIDYMPARGVSSAPPDVLRQLSRQHPALVRFGPTATTFVYLDHTRPPFDNPDARRAVNFAIDRAAVAEAQGGSQILAVTCQILPPGWPGHVPYCPYTVDPDASGQWHGPDMGAGLDLVERSGTQGMAVEIGPVRQRHAAIQEIVASALGRLGYEVTVIPPADDFTVFGALESGEIQVGVFEYGQVELSPSTFFDNFRCQPGTDELPCDEAIEALILDALELQVSDPAAAAEAWALADRAVVDAAYWAPLYVGGADLFSGRVGNAQFNPAYWVLVDQLWVR